jgi:uncharacterized protein DUF998
MALSSSFGTAAERALNHRTFQPSRARVTLWRNALLWCGIVAAILYVLMSFLVGFLWEGYNSTSQTISELSAIGAPTRPLWIALATVYTVLTIAFGWIVWKSAPDNRALRTVGALLMTQGVIGLFWPPMHQRTVLAAGGGTLTDGLHIAWTVVTSLFFVVAIAFGAAAFGRRFRMYSIATILILLIFGGLTGTYAPQIQSNLPTPGAGIWERVKTTAFMAWMATLALTILRGRRAGPN